MCKVYPGNTVLFARGRSNRRACPTVGVIDKVVSTTHAWVVCDGGRFLIRTKDCLALLNVVPSTSAEHRDAEEL